MKDRQIKLEELFSKNQELAVLTKEFSDDAILETLTKINVPISFGLRVLVQVYLHKQVDIGTLAGILLSEEYNEETISKYLDVMSDNDLIDYNETTEKFITVYDIDSKVKKDLEMYQFPLPMIVEPKKVKNNHSNGYLKCGNSSLLLNDSYHKEDICLDHINRVNRVPLSIDLDTAYNCKNQWKNLDKKLPKESLKEFRQRVKNFEKYMQTAYRVMEILTQEGNKVYLTHAYDKRGRTYSRGYHFLDQGNDWNKACVQFFNKEFIE